MRIGLLGGSFDPIHNGHIAIAKASIEMLNLDEFHFIPTKINPWKTHAIASTKQRKDMIELAIKDYPNFKLNEIELNEDENKKSYTIDTVLALIERYPEVDFYYFMGMDQVMSFDKWKKAKAISERVQLVAYNRGGYPYFHENIDKYHFLKLENKPLEISSTMIRNGEIQHLNPLVLAYLTKNGIYLDTMIKKYMHEKRYKHSLSVAALTKVFCETNGLDGLKGYVAGMMHDIAKEMPIEKSREIMEKHFASHLDASIPVWHQWISSYLCQTEYYLEDREILNAIENHTTGSLEMDKLSMCLYCADKLDPLRGYDSSKEIEICKQDIEKGFQRQLNQFYDYSTKHNRKIDPIFFEIYKKYVGGEING